MSSSRIRQTIRRHFDPEVKMLIKYYDTLDEALFGVIVSYPFELIEKSRRLVKKLLDAGANPNYVTKHDLFVERDVFHTPLTIAKDVEIVKILLNANADPNFPNSVFNTPLHTQNNIDIVNLLINAGADVNRINLITFETPLFYAVSFENIEKVQTLLNAGANPNLRDQESRTPLFLAVIINNIEITRLLLNNHANPLFYDITHRNILDYAIENNNHEMIELLRDIGLEETRFPNVQPLQGNAFQIHNAFNKINKEEFLEFMKTTVGYLDIPTISNIEFVNLLKTEIETIRTTMSNTNSRKSRIKNEFEQIFKTLKGIDYIPEYREIILYSVQFMKNQPQKFQYEYISNFTYDCLHAYSGPRGQSCAKGMIERFVFSLIPAAMLYIDTSEYTERKYNLLISILNPMTLNERITEFGRLCLEQSETADAFRDCIKQKLREQMGDTYNESATNIELSRIIPILGVYSGGGGGKKYRKLRKYKTFKHKKFTNKS